MLASQKHFFEIVSCIRAYNFPLHSLEGYGGSQIWVTDGTSEGTVRYKCNLLVFRIDSGVKFHYFRYCRAFDRSGNDLYIDRRSLDSAYPAKFGSFNEFLYVPANYGQYSQIMPNGGYQTNTSSSDPLAYTRNQAVVISDVDTAADGNVTVTISASSGLILLRDRTESGAVSPPSLHLLLAESRVTDQMMLTTALLALGHTVDVVTDGRTAYAAVVARWDSTSADAVVYLQTHPLPVNERQYDGVIMAERFLSDSSEWDGLQATRRIRLWEERHLNNSTSKRIPIIGMGKHRDLVGDSFEMAAAGADTFILQPATDYIDPASLDVRVPLFLGATTSNELKERAEGKMKYREIALTIHNFLLRTFSSMNITNLSPPTASQLPDLSVLASLPGPVYTLGSSIQLQGNLSAINEAMERLFFLSTNESSGAMSLTVSVSDSPGPCILPPNARSPFARRPMYPIVPMVNVSISAYSFYTPANESIAMQQLCDTSLPQTAVESIATFVVEVNQPPTISGGPENSSFSAITDTLQIISPSLVVADADHLSSLVPPIPTVDDEPPISVRFSAQLGRLSLTVQAGLNILQGIGYQDRVLSISGPIRRVNDALAAMTYTCRSVDGCAAGLSDVLSMTVNDEGFNGKGGPLSASKQIAILLV